MIGSKGGWHSTIFLSCKVLDWFSPFNKHINMRNGSRALSTRGNQSSKVFHDRSILNYGNILYLLDGYIFALLFETTAHCFCCLLVWLRKKEPCVVLFFPVEFSSHVGCPPLGAKTL